MNRSTPSSPKTRRILWLLLRLTALAAILLFFVLLLHRSCPRDLFARKYLWIQPSAAQRMDSDTPFPDGSRLTQRFYHEGDLAAVCFLFHTETASADPDARFEATLYDDVTGQALESVVTPVPVGTQVSQINLIFSQEHRTESGRYRITVTPYALEEHGLALVRLEGALEECIGDGELDGESTGFVSLQTIGISTRHLLRLYRIFCAGMLLCVLLLCVLFLFVRCPVTVRFVLAALLLGLLCGTVFPPFTSYDEDRHFGTAYYGAQKLLYPDSEAVPTDEKDHSNFTIHAIPGRTADERDELYPISYTPLDFYRFYGAADVSFGHTNDTDGTLYMPLMDVPSETGAYFPAVAFILLGRLVGVGGDLLPVLARVGNFLAYVALCAWGIAIAPKCKHLLFACALLPSALLITCSAANDLYHCGTGILLVGVALSLGDAALPLRRSHFAAVALCFAAMLVSKQLQLLPLFVWIGWLLYRRRYTPRLTRRFWLTAGLLTAAALVLWFLAVRLGVITSPADIDPGKQMELTYILCHPLRALRMLLDSAVSNASTYYIQWIGTLLGWGYLRTGLLPAVLLTALLLLAGVSTAGESRLPLRFRAGAHLSALAVIGLSFCVGFAWTTLTYYETNGTLWGIQGRYFLSAMAPLLLLIPAPPRRLLTPERATFLAQTACFGICLTDVFIFLRSLTIYLLQ